MPSQLWKTFLAPSVMPHWCSNGTQLPPLRSSVVSVLCVKQQVLAAGHAAALRLVACMVVTASCTCPKARVPQSTSTVTLTAGDIVC